MSSQPSYEESSKSLWIYVTKISKSGADAGVTQSPSMLPTQK